jgi:hypothetical protein
MARGKGVSLSTVLLILVLIIGAGMYFGFIRIPALPGQIASTTAPSELVAVQRKIQFSLVDPLGGSAIASAQIKVYKGTSLLESLTTDTYGIATTSLLYNTGDQLTIWVNKSNYVRRYIPVQVPAMSKVDAETGNPLSIPLQMTKTPTVTIKITDQFGNVYSGSNNKLNFTALGQTSVAITVTIYNTLDNSGFIGSRDILNNVDWKLVHYISTDATKSTIQGFERSAQRGTTLYYFNTLPDDALTKQKVGQTYVKTGVYSLTFTVGKGSLGSNQSETYTFYVMMYADVNNFINQGIFSYDAVQLASFSLILAA